MAYEKELDPTSKNEPLDRWAGWICCVIPFYHRNTVTGDEGNATRARNEPFRIAKPFMIQNQILSWNINFNKQTRVPMMDVDLTAGPVDLLKRAGAGDWVFFWAFTNRNDYERILASVADRISKYEQNVPNNDKNALNDFDSGLKFVGRVHGVRRSKSVSATGIINTRYFLTAVAMQEAETKIVVSSEGRTAYNNVQTDPAKNETAWLNAIFGNATKLIQETEGSIGIVSPNRLIRRVIDLFLGPGSNPLKNIDTSGLENDDKEDIDAQKSTSPNSSINVPALVANFLGHKTARGRTSAYFSSIIGKSIGVELYNDNKNPVPNDWNGLKGSFILQSDQVINKSVWDIIEECACQPLNEVYTAMRLNKVNGKLRILPTITVRQIPMNDMPSPSHTTVLGLPRWVVSSKMVVSEDVGVSDANRYNYIWLHPIDPSKDGQAAVLSAANMLKRSPPIFDATNAKRSGLRTMVAEFRLVDTSSDGKGVGDYSYIVFDAIRNGHLKWNGRIVTVGIQEPISIGDNVLYDDVLYNINGIAHRGRVNSSTGEKGFDTTIELANGISFSKTKAREGGSDFPDAEQPDGLGYDFSNEPGPKDAD